MTAVTRTLLGGLVDYAGLFPPAALDMSSAARNFASYRAGDEAWMLGRFVVPVSRLAELESAAASLLPRDEHEDPWRISALATDVEGELPRVEAFNVRHADALGGSGAAVVDTLEIRVSTPGDIVRAASALRGTLNPYFEIPLSSDPASLIATIATVGARAKVRTGGVTRDVFPTAAELTTFMRCCHDAGVPFKATAGLHHPLRAEYRLTYERDSATGMMFGFLNVFLAAAFLRHGVDDREVQALLEERDPRALRFEDERIAWRGHTLDLGDIAAARRDAAISFGSCSFTEPVDELRALTFLE